MKKLLMSLLVFFMMVSLCGAAEVAGVSVSDSIKAGQDSLLLNGAGVRTKFFMDLYVGCLYVKEKGMDAGQIVAADAPMAIKMQIISGLITSDKMEKTTREGFVNATGGNTAPIQNEIDTFIAVFNEKIEKGDVYDLIYVPGKGVETYKNGTYASITKGLDFKKALFGIWLGDKPAQKSLKKEMLGQ
ncbi:MAG: chalcone isomerase family protein [Deltaproteobacteria bacterium]|nr:chalcone isomerase family protein [Deltaproteobacteria bacterium]